MVDTNALYYTFSTVAQSLAGAVAVFAAFALYKLQALDKAVADGTICAINACSDYPSIREAASRGEHAKFFDLFDAQFGLGHPWPGSAYQQAAIQQMREAVAQRRAILRSVRFLVPAVFMTMIAAVAALPCVPWLAQSETLSGLVVWVLGISFVVSVWLLGTVLLLLVGRGTRPASLPPES